MNSRYRQERHRPPYYLLTGLILGLIAGFVFTFFVYPIQYTNVPPETLQTVDKDQYRLMIAYAYHASNDIGRATSRLGLLREENLAEVILNQAQRSERRSDAQILLYLAEALQGTPSAQQSNAPDLVSLSTPMLTPLPQGTAVEGASEPTLEMVRTATAQPTAPDNTPTPSVTPVNSSAIPFRLAEQSTVCNAALTESYIQVLVMDENNAPIGNVRVLVSWEGGQDIFYTGYFPEISAGYADFSMQPSLSYSVRIGEIGELVSEISAPTCQDDSGNSFPGSISLLFIEP